WNESLTVGDDTELEIRAMVANIDIMRLEEILLFLRRGEYARMGTREESEKFKTAYQTFTIIWQHLIQAGAVTELRRLLALQNVFATSWRASKAGRLRT